MPLTLSVLLQAYLAELVLLLLALPSGYLFGRMVFPRQFRTTSAVEQLLWSVGFSVPVSLGVVCILGRFVPAWCTSLALLCLDGGCAWLLTAGWKAGSLPPWHLDRRGKVFLLCWLAIALLIPLAGAPLQVHGKLFEPVFSSDWEIRLPLIQAAAHSNPPLNPFFTLHGRSPAMRYYYYWFSLCAQLTQLSHVMPRPALLASSCYALTAILSVLLLLEKHMVRSEEDPGRRGLLVLGLCGVLGLDIVPNAIGLYFWKLHVIPEPEWWAADRTPGLLSTVLFSPHHIAGAAMGLFAFLLFTLLPEDSPISRRELALKALTLGLLFSALLGTSTFICMFFALACSVWALLRWRSGDARYALVLVLAGVAAFAISAPYLRELLGHTSQATASTGKHTHLLAIRLRDLDFAHSLVDKTFSSLLHTHRPEGAVRFAYRAPLLPLLWVCEFGFFLFVVVAQFRRDFLSAYVPSSQERALWVLAATVGVFFFFVDSTPIQSINDLGFQAGIVLRLVYIVWGARVCAQYLTRRQRQTLQGGKLFCFHVAVTFLVLGVVLSVWQAIVNRSYLALVNEHVIHSTFPFPRAPQVASVYNDVYEAQQAAARALPADAVIQSDPVGRYQTVFRLYQARRQAAGDRSCEGAFGGDPVVCQSFVPSILKLYGTQEKLSSGERLPESTPADRRLEAFADVCKQVGLSAVLASRIDPAWYQPDSWVWKGDVLYANNTVRVIRCPGA